MGILNVTDDSFFAGSRLSNASEIVSKAGQMLAEGAEILDIGAYSSRPGATDITEEIESDKIKLAVEVIIKEFPEAIISIDTFRSAVAEVGLDAGAKMINDISGGIQDPRIFKIAGDNHAPIVLMHMRGTPQNMQKNCEYDNLTKDVIYFLQEQINMAKSNGALDVIVDPGFGFSKTIDQNYELLNSLERFSLLDAPILVGMSRKSMIYKKLNTSAEAALNGTSVLNTIALAKGASILRVHDVKEAFEAIQLMEAIHCAE